MNLFKSQNHPPMQVSATATLWEFADSLTRRIDNLTDGQKAHLDRRFGWSDQLRESGLEPEAQVVVNRLSRFLGSREGLRYLSHILPRVHRTPLVEVGAAL